VKGATIIKYRKMYKRKRKGEIKRRKRKRKKVKLLKAQSRS